MTALKTRRVVPSLLLSSLSKPVVSLFCAYNHEWRTDIDRGHCCPSVCLLTKEDSLSYNRLIPPPPKDFNLISNENRSNHSFVGGVMVFVSLSAPTTTTWNISRVTLAGEGSNGMHWLWRMTNWQAFIAYRCAIFSSPSIFPQCKRQRACAPYSWARVNAETAMLVGGGGWGG